LLAPVATYQQKIGDPAYDVTVVASLQDTCPFADDTSSYIYNTELMSVVGTSANEVTTTVV
jgi:hypothetical protein